MTHFFQYSRFYKGIVIAFSGYFVFAMCHNYSEHDDVVIDDEKHDDIVQDVDSLNSALQINEENIDGVSENKDAEHEASVADSVDNSSKISTVLKDVKIAQHDALYVEGTIKNNFYTSAIEAGVPNKVIKSFVKILGKKVNFRSGVRNGDTFSVVFDKNTYVILYLQINVKRTQITAYKGDDDKYYYKDGSPINGNVVYFKKPIEKARISSPFGYRMHPVLGVLKKHSGIDYAAPKGTPVFAACDGVIKRRAYDHFSGKHIVIKHANGYETLYAHLSSFDDVKVGEHVLCGARIGRVGSTGRSTGAHLHYAVRKNGVYVNPAKGMSIRGRVKLCSSKYRNFTNAIDSAIKDIKTPERSF